MTPVGCTTAYGVVELMKSCGCERPAADFDPEAMAGLSIAGHTIAGFDWVKAMGWDITSVSQVLGCTLGEPAIDLPLCVKGHPYREQIAGLDCPSNFTELGRFPVFAEQFRIIKERLGDRVAIFGMSEGPFTAGANLVGTDKMMRATIRDPETRDLRAGGDHGGGGSSCPLRVSSTGRITTVSPSRHRAPSF